MKDFNIPSPHWKDDEKESREKLYTCHGELLSVLIKIDAMLDYYKQMDDLTRKTLTEILNKYKKS